METGINIATDGLAWYVIYWPSTDNTGGWALT